MVRTPQASARLLRRPGKVLVLFALLLPVLLGMVGLVIDAGMLWATYRQTQNTADAAAMAAALDKMRGNTDATALATANTFVTLNSPSSPTLTLNGGTIDSLNIPPTQGPYAGNSQYVEAIVSRSLTTLFMHIVGVSQNEKVAARAVAGYEARSSGEGAIVLNPNARPGISVQGTGASLKVDGAVIINSGYTGVDSQSNPVKPYSFLTPGYAATTSNGATFMARYIQVAGGVDTPANYVNYDTANPDSPLFANYKALSPDPLRSLLAPTSSNVTSITNWTRIPAMTINSGQSVTLNPGVYEDINILQNTTVTLNPGVYILSPTKPNQGFRTNGSTTITGNGVMIYPTGSDYLDTSPGYWDTQDDAQNSLDGPLPPTTSVYTGSETVPSAVDPNFSKVSFATVDINANSSKINLTPIGDKSDPFYNVLFFQRRRNTNDVSVQGNAGENVNLSGTIYAKWANFKLAGGGKYDAQFVVGSLAISGQAAVTINSAGKTFGLANQIYLVE